jgi:hypothetical protein
MMGDEPMPLENDFWDPSMPLPFALRNPATLFELEITEHKRMALPPSAWFVKAADHAPTSVPDLLEGESCNSSSKSSPGEDSHPSWQCNIMQAAGVDPTGGACDKPAHPQVLRSPKEQTTYEQEKAERA